MNESATRQSFFAIPARSQRMKATEVDLIENDVIGGATTRSRCALWNRARSVTCSSSSLLLAWSSCCPSTHSAVRRPAWRHPARSVHQVPTGFDLKTCALAACDSARPTAPNGWGSATLTARPDAFLIDLYSPAA